MFGELLFRHLPIAPGIRALDLGCGAGFPLLELADRLGPSSTVHGIDSWAEAVTRARPKAQVRGTSNVHLSCADAVEMPYEDGFFDLIVSNVGVNNFAQPRTVMAKCRRVCAPEGRIALTTNLVGHMAEFYEVFESVLAETGNAGLVAALRKQEAHRATIKGFQKLFVDAGFEVTGVHAEEFVLHYADGSAFLNAYLTRLGFLDGWRGVLGEHVEHSHVFAALEVRLNEVARASGRGLKLTIPAAYMEGRPFT